MLYLKYLKHPISTVSCHFACTSALTFAKLCFNLHTFIFFIPLKLKSTRICHSTFLPQCLAHYRWSKKNCDITHKHKKTWFENTFQTLNIQVYHILTPKLILTMALFTILIYSLYGRMVTSSIVVAKICCLTWGEKKIYLKCIRNLINVKIWFNTVCNYYGKKNNIWIYVTQGKL